MDQNDKEQIEQLKYQLHVTSCTLKLISELINECQKKESCNKQYLTAVKEIILKAKEFVDELNERGDIIL